MHRQRVDILGTEVDRVTLDELLKEIEGNIVDKTPQYIITSNVDYLILKRKDRKFEKTFNNATYIVPDGAPLIWASKFLGTPLEERITGTDILMGLSELSAKKGHSIFLLGGAEGVADKVAQVLQKKFPGLRVAGTYSPYFGFEEDTVENDRIVRIIKETQPDILFAALGAPKGEKWIYDFYRSLGVPLSMNIGAVFDFVSGRIKRAPKWMQRIGFEWLWRLLKEPRRLWRRYLLRDMTFFYLLLRQKLIKKY